MSALPSSSLLFLVKRRTITANKTSDAMKPTPKTTVVVLDVKTSLKLHGSPGLVSGRSQQLVSHKQREKRPILRILTCIALLLDGTGGFPGFGRAGLGQPAELQRTLGDGVSAGLPAQPSSAPAGRLAQTSLSAAREGAPRLTQDDGAGDVHLEGGQVRVVQLLLELCLILF